MSKDKTFIIITGFFLTVIILGLQAIAVQHTGVLAATSDLSNITDSNSKNIQNNSLPITKILADELESHIQKARAIIELTSKLPQETRLKFINCYNKSSSFLTLYGYPSSNATIK